MLAIPFGKGFMMESHVIEMMSFDMNLSMEGKNVQFEVLQD